MIDDLLELIGEENSLSNIEDMVQRARYSGFSDKDLDMNIFQVETGERSIAVTNEDWEPGQEVEEVVIVFKIIKASPEAYKDIETEDWKEREFENRAKFEAQMEAIVKVVDIYEL